MAVKRLFEEGVFPEASFVFEEPIGSRENRSKKTCEEFFPQQPLRLEPGSSHVFKALTDLEVHLPKQLEQVLASRGLYAEISACPLGSWIQGIVQQPSFPKHSEVLEHIHIIMLNNIAKRIASFKDSLHLTFVPEDTQREYMLSSQLRIEVAQDCINTLSRFLSQANRQEALIAAAQGNQVNVIQAFLDSDKCDAAEKQQVFQWALERGWVDIFSRLAPEMLTTQRERSSAMLIASASRHSDLLQAILATGPVSEKDRQQALEQAKKMGIRK